MQISDFFVDKYKTLYLKEHEIFKTDLFANINISKVYVQK